MKWQEVPLSDIAKPVSRPVVVIPGQAYRTIGVKWWGGGAYERETIDGSRTAAKSLSIVQGGDLIINKIWVRHGSTAIASSAVAGCAASGEFPTFELDRSRVLARWLHWQTQTCGFWAKCDALSRGTSGKNRIKPELFLTISVPLPPLEEQRRIVARIEELTAKIEEARRLRQQSAQDVDAVIAAEEMRVWPQLSVEDAAPLDAVTTYLSRGRQSKQGDSDHYLIKTQHVQLGQYVRSLLTLSPEAAAKVNDEGKVRRGDILIACSAAGCLGRVAFYQEENVVVSTDTHVAVARADTTKVLPEYLYAYLRGAQGQLQLRSRERGDWTREKVGFRLTELNLADLKQVPVPLPEIGDQRRIVAELRALQARVDELKRLQAEIAAELDALLPSILDKAFKGEL